MLGNCLGFKYNEEMNTLYLKQIREMLAGVEKFIYDDSIEVRQVASYIMGQIMFHDDYDEIAAIHKDIEEFAEFLGSDNETMSEEYLRETDEISRMRRAFERLKARYCQESDVSDK